MALDIRLRRLATDAREGRRVRLCGHSAVEPAEESLLEVPDRGGATEIGGGACVQEQGVALKTSSQDVPSGTAAKTSTIPAS
jgi:hypothetical protein